MASLHYLFLMALLTLLCSCGALDNVPDQDLGSGNKKPASKPVMNVSQSSGKTYKVVKGDTLFSISLRFDLDYKKLAAANNIESPYVIHPNDEIYLRESNNIKPATAVYPVKNPVITQTQKNTGVVDNKVVKHKTEASLNSVNKDVPNQHVPVVVEKVHQANSSVVVKKESKWIWPLQGNVVREFSPQDALSKGIDISAAEGTSVVSARSGEVVYAGSGLKGYGNLIIIRHDETYISAYAHNRVILVKEGQSVQQGEKVAESGMSGTQSPKLHFEIREQGKPINPLKLLPTR